MTDAEINEAVAKALGFSPVCDTPLGTVWGNPSGEKYTLCVPPWATSLDACFRDLVPEARSRNLKLELEQMSAGQAQWFVTWWDLNADDEDDFEARAIDLSPSRAICLAWLKTKEIA